MNSKEHGLKVFQFVKASEDKLVLQHKPLFANVEEVLVELSELKKWKLCKSTPPEVCPDAIVQKLWYTQSPAVVEEQQRACVQSTLLDACFKDEGKMQCLAFSNKPAAVWTMEAVKKKGVLVFLPVGTISKVKGDPPVGKPVIQAFGAMWLISPFKTVTEWDQSGTLAPFWWVKSTEDQAQANMVFVDVTIGACKIPVLQNNGAIPAKTQLLVAKTVKADAKKKAKTAHAGSNKS